MITLNQFKSAYLESHRQPKEPFVCSKVDVVQWSEQSGVSFYEEAEAVEPMLSLQPPALTRTQDILLGLKLLPYLALANIVVTWWAIKSLCVRAILRLLSKKAGYLRREYKGKVDYLREEGELKGFAKIARRICDKIITTDSISQYWTTLGDVFIYKTANSNIVRTCVTDSDPRRCRHLMLVILSRMCMLELESNDYLEYFLFEAKISGISEFVGSLDRNELLGVLKELPHSNFDRIKILVESLCQPPAGHDQTSSYAHSHESGDGY